MGTSAAMIWNVSLLRKVWLENVRRVGFDPMEEVIINCVEQFGDSRDVIAAIAKPFHATQQQVKAHSVGSQSHPGPSWRRILDARDDYRSKYVMQRCSRRAMRA